MLLGHCYAILECVFRYCDCVMQPSLPARQPSLPTFSYAAVIILCTVPLVLCITEYEEYV